MAAKQILVVEDEKPIRDMIGFGLRRAGFEVREAVDARSARAELANRRPDLVLMDWMLPDTSGLEFTRQLKRDPNLRDLPVIMLTARAEEPDKIAGLEGGADDYVTKPFSPREIVARVKAILRRSESPSKAPVPEVLVCGDVTVDMARREVTVAGRAVALATREFDLLAHFASNQGLVLSRQQLLDGVWGVGWYGDERTVDVHVRQLRKKLGDALPLKTVFGVGYRLG
jgi:two-component system phosphate regulon response regulator PhoB